MNVRVMTQQEALEEFTAELERLADEEQRLQEQYDSGRWAMSSTYSSANR